MTLKNHVAVGVTVVVVAAAMCSTAMVSVETWRTATAASSQQKNVLEFYVDYLRAAMTLTRLGDQIGLSWDLGKNPNTTDYSYELAVMDEETGNIETSLSELQRQQRHAKRRAPLLRAADHKFDAFVDAIEATITESILFQALLVSNPVAAVTFVQPYRIGGVSFDNESDVVNGAMQRYYDSVQLQDKKARRTSINVTLLAVAVTLLALTLLFGTLLRLEAAAYARREAEAKVAAQERLVRQQAHEVRNRFSPAITMMRAFLDATKLDEYTCLREDMQTALSLLHEVEGHYQTRLDVYKILRGAYELRPQIFDLGLLLHERCSAERAIARAKAQSAGVELNVQFQVGLPRAIYKRVNVETDAYVVSHILSNLLSNSRKYTNVGTVKVVFAGIDDGRLVFRVEDTGVGIPEEIRGLLFTSEVTTGDTRGTGLGLPSCAVFARTAGGYIKLVSSRLQDETTDHGASLFEFAVQGRLVDARRVAAHDSTTDFVFSDANPTYYADASLQDNESDGVADFSDALPGRVQVVVVDDSAINRRCVMRSLQQATTRLRVDNWTYTEFETVEAAQPTLRHIAANPHTIVTLDQSLETRGGILTGSDGIKWLRSINFQGIIVSASGDDDIGRTHLELGAAVAWGKPLPPLKTVQADLETCFATHRSPNTCGGPTRNASLGPNEDEPTLPV